MSEENTNDENGNEATPEPTPETSNDRPIFNPEMIVENSQDSSIDIPSDEQSDNTEKSEK